MYKKSLVLTKRAITMLTVLVMVVSLLPVMAQTKENRLTAQEHLKAYYNFETGSNMGADASGNNNNLVVGWGYTPTQVTSDATLGLGMGAKFSSVTAMRLDGSVYNQREFLDDLDTYTLSMFFQNTAECAGGILFNNKFWGGDGVRISVNKWADASATGQAEMYLDYNYIDTNGAAQTYHGCVKFIPDAQGAVDQTWHHIALAVDTPNHIIKLYYDGELVHENSDMNELIADCQEYPFAFGGMLDPQWPDTSSPFDGALDEIRIYDFVATDDEADALSQNNLSSGTGEDEEEEEEEEIRLSAERLEAYYNFEVSNQMGKDVSGNNNYLKIGWGYAPTQVDTDEALGLGKGAKFNSVSTLIPYGSAYDQNDFIDNMGDYTLSMFYQSTAEGTGGILFNNKYWGESGVRVSVNKWPDAAATGQVEMYFDYNYRDMNGTEQNFRNCVKFIPDVQGAVDQSWHHIAITVDKTNHTIKLYFDGEVVHENSNMQALLVDSQKYPAAFGALFDPQWNNTNSPFDGAIDEIRIYDFPANDSEIALLSKNEVHSVEEEKMGNVPVLDKYDLYTYTLPYWEGDTVYNESLVILKGKDGSVPEKTLMYPATEIISVRSQDLKTVYTEGTDYILKDGKITFPSTSTIPMMNYSELYSDTAVEGATFTTFSGEHIYYSEELQKRQINVTYKHNSKWSGDIPSYQGAYIPNTIEKFKNKEAVNIVFYGDSITEGYSASGFFGFAPYTEPWSQMTGKVLREKYDYKDINIINSALAGTDTVWGMDDTNLTPRVISKNPDLVVIAYGMNDSTRPTAEYRNNIKTIIEKIRAVHPDTEFLLVSNMLPNPGVLCNHGLYQNELLALQSELSGIGVVRLTDAFNTVVSNKDYYDVGSNNYNHPSDFIVRLYAQTAIAALYGNVDISALLDAISDAEKLDKSMYTANSWNNLQAALTKARSLLLSSDQTAIDEGVATLKIAINTLVTANRLNLGNLKAYYNFEESSQMGKDVSGNTNNLMVGWGYEPTQIDGNEALGLGKGANFGSQSVLVPVGFASNQNDFLDNMNAYTLSMFFQNTAEGTGGILFNNKYWNESGVRISVNKWPDPAATGQVEMYFDYNYLDTNGTEQVYHNCVKFIPDIAGAVDRSWHHIALTVDKANHTIKLYYDGALVHENSNMQALLADSQKYPVAFGALYDTQYQNTYLPFDGAIDEIRIYDFAANDSEVAKLRQNNLPSGAYGDSNGDGKVNVLDLIEVKNHLLNVSELSDKAIASVDMDNNAEVNIIDLCIMKDYIQETSVDFVMEIGSKNIHNVDGFGVQVNPEYFMGYNTKYGVGEADWKLFEERVEELRVAKFRINIMPDYYEPVNDDNDPNNINWQGFNFDSEYMKAVCKILDVAQKNNIKVNITSYGAAKDSWLGYPTVEENAWWLTPPVNLEEYAESTAAVLKYLIETKGYTCIYQYTPFNEPDFGFTKGTEGLRENVDFNLYVDFCETIHNRLVKEGIRDKINFNLSDDATYHEWLKKVTENETLKEIGDSFNSHVYLFDAVTSDNTMLSHLSMLTGFTADKPFQILEFGSGQCVDWPITTQNDLETYERGLMYARAAINLLNAGGVGYTSWTLFDYMRTDDRMMKTGMYGFHTDNWALRPFYHSYSLITRFCRPDSEVYKGIEKNSNGYTFDANQENGISGTFLKSEDGKWTQLLTNDNDYSVTVKFVNPNLKNATLKKFLYSQATLPTNNEMLSQSGTISCRNGEVIVTVPARSFVALTNID